MRYKIFAVVCVMYSLLLLLPKTKIYQIQNYRDGSRTQYVHLVLVRIKYYGFIPGDFFYPLKDFFFSVGCYVIYIFVLRYCREKLKLWIS